MSVQEISASEQRPAHAVDVFTSAVWWNRLGAACGIIFVVLTIAGVSMSRTSDGELSHDQESAVIARLLEDNQNNMRLGLAIVMVGVFFLFWFVASIYRRIQSVEPNASVLGVVALGGGLVTAAAMLILIHTGIALTVVQSYGNDTQVARTLFVLTSKEEVVLGAPMAALVGATSAASLLYHVLPRWLGVLGIPFVVFMLALPLVVVGLFLFFLWVLLVSIAILIRPVSPRLSDARIG